MVKQLGAVVGIAALAAAVTTILKRRAAPPPVPDAAPAEAAPAPGGAPQADPAAAIDEARDRLRARADALRSEIEGADPAAS